MVVVAFALALLAVTACSGDDDEAAPTTTTAAVTTTTTAPAEQYPDQTGEQYAGTDNWICHPELADSVCTDLRTTVVDAAGGRRVTGDRPAADAPFDCFYVYPTTSTDPTPNSDLDVDDSETSTVRAQVARYGSVCRVFAPAYRQVTLVGIFGAATAEGRELAYADVLDAWRTYVDEASDGRPFALIGHSQGAGHLRRLLAEEIAPVDALRERLVSAVLLGSAVADGSIPGVATCTSADEAGCLVSYASYPADAPPGDDALFGRVRDTGEPAVCVDPVALLGGDGIADAVLPTEATLFGSVTEDLGPVDTPFVAFPDALRTSCEEAGGRRWLAVGTTGQEDVRPVERILRQLPDATWGTHLADANLAQDDLLALLARQGEALLAGG